MISFSPRAVVPVAILIIGAVFMSSLFGCSGKFSYDKYYSKTPGLEVSLDYLKGWQAKESRNAQLGFTLVTFLIPDKKENRFSAKMALVVKEIDPGLALDELAKEALDKAMQMKEFRLVSNRQVNIAGKPAAEIVITYSTLDGLHRAGGGLIPVKERMVIRKSSGRSYLLRYENTAADFSKLDPAFSHITHSLIIGKK
jgi:hypothetical protein